jgi:integrase
MDGTPIQSFKKSFEQTLKRAGVLYDGSDGKKRTPYSLRHTYATMRLSEGVSVFSWPPTWARLLRCWTTSMGRRRVRDPKMAMKADEAFMSSGPAGRLNPRDA